jgi:hypothetical protein
MITRAQAEALLTLAESLEACEQLGLQMSGGEDGEWIFFSGGAERVGNLTGMNVRLAVNALIPKSET